MGQLLGTERRLDWVGSAIGELRMNNEKENCLALLSTVSRSWASIAADEVGPTCWGMARAKQHRIIEVAGAVSLL